MALQNHEIITYAGIHEFSIISDHTIYGVDRSLTMYGGHLARRPPRICNDIHLDFDS